MCAHTHTNVSKTMNICKKSVDFIKINILPFFFLSHCNVKCYHWEELDKGYTGLQLHGNLQLSQNKRFHYQYEIVVEKKLDCV